MKRSPVRPAIISIGVRFDRFSRRTRLYLQRRAFRYFRNIGRKDRERYRRAMVKALAQYQDAHLSRPEQLLDSWGLLHALYWGSAVIHRWPRGARLVPGRALSELTPGSFIPTSGEGASMTCWPCWRPPAVERFASGRLLFSVGSTKPRWARFRWLASVACCRARTKKCKAWPPSSCEACRESRTCRLPIGWSC